MCPLLAIPAIQSRSQMLAFKAVLLGPALVFIQTLAGLVFALDNRINCSIAVFVPGGWITANPGGPVAVLMVHLAIFWILTGALLHGSYRGSRMLGLGYLARLCGAGFFLEVILAYEIQFTTLGWGEYLGASDNADRLRWIVASTTWLLACGLFTTLVFGLKPTEPTVNKITVEGNVPKAPAPLSLRDN